MTNEELDHEIARLEAEAKAKKAMIKKGGANEHGLFRR